MAIKPKVPCGELSVVEFVANSWEFAKQRFEKYDRQTGTLENYRPALRLLRDEREARIDVVGAMYDVTTGSAKVLRGRSSDLGTENDASKMPA